MIGDFGIVAGLGVGLSLIVMLTLLPAGRMIIDRRRESRGTLTQPRPVANALPGIGRVAEVLGRSVTRRPAPYFVAVLAVTIGLGFAATGLQSGFSIRDILPSSGTVLEDPETLDTAVGGSTEIASVLVKAEATETRTLLNLHDLATAFEDEQRRPLIFAWWGIEGREPQWSLPADQPDQTGWSNHEIQTLRFPGHPQETTENSVDLAHLRYVHGYDNVGRFDPVTVDGPYLESRWDFRSIRKIARIATLTFEFKASASVAGLGYSFVEVHERSIPMDMRLWVLATPVDGTLIDLSLASQLREIRNPKRRVVGLGFLPPRLRAPIMNKIMASQQKQDVQQDVVIWSRKQYLSGPRLNRSDGEIAAYRAYCAQFYPDPSDCGRSIT